MAECAAEAMRGVEPTAEMVAVEVVTVCRIPKSWKGQKRIDALCAASAPSGDVDNFAKSVLDGMNGIVWEDDGQVVLLSAQKRWAQDDEEEGVDVKVSHR